MVIKKFVSVNVTVGNFVPRIFHQRIFYHAETSPAIILPRGNLPSEISGSKFCLHRNSPFENPILREIGSQNFASGMLPPENIAREYFVSE